MIGVAGQTATIVAAGMAGYGAILALLAFRGRARMDPAIRAAWCAAGALVAANLLMIAALIADDFSISYVAQVGSRETPLLYKVSSLWGALEGSILFWAGLLALVTVLLISRTRGTPDADRLPAAVSVLLALTAFFALVTAGPASPWGRVWPVPIDGPGPNPLLQDHPLMAFHPPLLYLGFVGLAIPFALTVDALAGGRLDHGWLRLARSWTLAPWALLTLGLIAGAWWSYAVLGWGGYWAWDPVENVALLPWLTATAFLHSAMVGRRSGQLVTWNVLLVAASFALTLFATLVTRSGILDSVHAFTRSAIGYLFVGLLGAVVAGTIGLLALRLPPARPPTGPGLRGSAFLLNNLLFAAIATTVLVGTLFPLVVEALVGDRVSVGAPYFERVIGPLAAGLLVLTGVGPALPWGSWSRRASRSLVGGAVAALAVSSVTVWQGAGPETTAGVAAATFALAQSMAFLAARIRGSSSAPRALLGRSAAGLLSHLGVALLALAVIGSVSGRREAVVALEPGQTATVLDRIMTFITATERDGPNRRVIEAEIRAGPDDLLRPALSVFQTSSQAIATPAIVPGASEDFYVTLLNVDAASGAATIRVGVHPFVSWIWPAGALIAAGGLLAAIPARSRRRTDVPQPAEQRAALPRPVTDGPLV